MQLRDFVRRAAGVGSVSLFDRAAAVCSGIVFARWLGPAEFGAYSFVIATVGLLLLPARLGLPELLTRDLAASRGSGIALPIIATVTKGYLLVGGAALAIIGIGQIVFRFLPNTPLSELMKVGLWLILPNALFEVTIGILRGLGRTFAFQIYGTLLLTLVTLSIGATTMIVADRYEAPIAIGARFLALCVLLAIAALHLWSIIRQHRVKDAAPVPSSATLLRTGFAFMLNAMLYMALMRIDIVVLGLIIDETSVGLYRVAVEGGLLVAFAYGAVITVLGPEYARLHAGDNMLDLQRLSRQAARLIMLVGGVAAVIMMLFAYPIILIVFGREYTPASTALSVLAAGHFITFFFGDPIHLLNMTGHHNRITAIVAIGLAISVIACLLLVPLWGIVGAGVSASLALIVYRILAYRAVYKLLGINCGIFGRSLIPARPEIFVADTERQ